MKEKLKNSSAGKEDAEKECGSKIEQLQEVFEKEQGSAMFSMTLRYGIRLNN